MSLAAACERALVAGARREGQAVASSSALAVAATWT
jgi:hypothetical protein